MTKFTKAQFDIEGDSLHLGVPFSKVNKESRTVSGFATLDNVDTQGDIVLAEASRDAFARSRGNIREMHQPIAVGKMVDFKEKEFIDATDGKVYRGIYVTVRVSKGAQDTWEKVLDGTLSGFSIGGAITDSETQWVKDANSGEGGSVRFVKKYDLTELSLVDNPANQKANVFSFTKVADGNTMLKGMVADTRVENVFYCDNSEHAAYAETDEAEVLTCKHCESDMKVIGWAEQGDLAGAAEVVTKFRANEGSLDMKLFKKASGDVSEPVETETTEEEPKA